MEPKPFTSWLLTQVEGNLKAEADNRQAEHRELQMALMGMPPVPAETSAGRMLEIDGTDVSRSGTRSYRDSSGAELVQAWRAVAEAERRRADFAEDMAHAAAQAEKRGLRILRDTWHVQVHGAQPCKR